MTYKVSVELNNTSDLLADGRTISVFILSQS